MQFVSFRQGFSVVPVEWLKMYH